jgi:nucleotide-binding universal stress UspA family protein
MNRIIVPVSGYTCDQRALEVAVMLADGNTEISLVRVVEVAQSLPLEAEMPAEIEGCERALDTAEEIARRLAKGKVIRITPELLQARAAGPAIVDEAIDKNADMIVLSLRNHRRHGQKTQGSTVDYVLRNAPCEVIVTRRRQEINTETLAARPVQASVS